MQNTEDVLRVKAERSISEKQSRKLGSKDWQELNPSSAVGLLDGL